MRMCFILIFVLIALQSIHVKCEESHSHSHSHEKHHKNFQYACNDLEWVPYLLDEAPAENGVYMGDSTCGIPAYVGYGLFKSVLGTAYGTGQVQITEPRGLFAERAHNFFSNDTSEIFYLKNNCEYKFKWVTSMPGEIIPFGVESFTPMANGFHDYYGRKKISDEKTVFGSGIPSAGILFYVDSVNYPYSAGASDDYEVLTCKSTYFSPPQIASLPPMTINPQTDCVHEWRKYNNDDEPSRNGVSAGLWDVNNSAFVGKIFDNDIWRAARIQVENPGSGTYASVKGNYSFFPSGGYYLYNNPKYHYYWVDSFDLPLIPNSVNIPLKENASFVLPIGRIQIDGEVHVTKASNLGFSYCPKDKEIYARNYQTLVCDPKPINKCKQEWKPYQNDDAPSVDGFKVDFYENGIVSYIGRSDNKRIFGHDYVIGRVQTLPQKDSGVYTLQSVSGGEKFDPHQGEYLVKNSGDLYEWVNAHTGQEVRNALSISVTHASDCCQDGHHKEKAYIGKFYLDNVAYVGTVYERQGLTFVDVNGKKRVVSSFQVLTCASPVKCEEEEMEHHHHDCNCDHQCLDEERFYYN